MSIRATRSEVIEQIARMIVASPDRTNSLFEQHNPTLAETKQIQRRIREMRQERARIDSKRLEASE